MRDLGLNNLVFGRDPTGALSVGTLSARTIQAQKLQVPVQLKNSCGWYTFCFVHAFGSAVLNQPNCWVNVGVQYSPTNRSAVAFWRDPLQVVHLQGHLRGGVIHKPMFTLPIGLRPAKNKSFVVAGGTLDNQPSTFLHIIRISETGDVVLDAGNNTWISLDGITFRAGD